MIRLVTDLQPYLVNASTPIREVMIRFGSAALPYPFLLIVDDAARLLGTVTDGDLRRAVLKGLSLEDSIDRAMKMDPRIGRWKNAAENERLLKEVASKLRFLPLVDDQRVLRGVLLQSAAQNQTVSALIMAGGFGKRLGEITRNKPKPLVQVGGQPILAHILNGLEQTMVSRIYISVHFLAEQIREFIAARTGEIPVEFINEEKPLGTVGALAFLPETAVEPLVVLNGDILTKLDFNNFIDFHFRHQNDATLAVAQHAVQIPFGVVRHTKEGFFTGIEEKPVLRNFVAAGLYLLSSEFRNLIIPGESIDMPELLNRGHAAGLRCGLFPIHEYWTDIGRPEDLANADGFRADEDDLFRVLD
jgi:dTDP-glucose pyrophosphorylase